VAVIGFADRLAYVRWLRARGKRAPETDTEFAANVGVGAKWLGKWKNKPNAPEGRTEAAAISAALAGMGVSLDWLYDGKGSPPEPIAWKRWLADAERASRQPTLGPSVIKEPAEIVFSESSRAPTSRRLVAKPSRRKPGSA
jgi:hypothetical protein